MKMGIVFVLVTAAIALKSDLVYARPANLPPVTSCANDDWTSNLIESHVAVSDRMSVYNAAGEMVGVFDHTPETGDLGALYLCGNNEGYYYARGNLRDREITSMYNDEYDVDLEVEPISSGLKIKMKVYWSDPESEAEFAVYKRFTTEIFVRLP